MKFKVFSRTVGFQLLAAFVILWPPIDRLTVRLFLWAGIVAWVVIALLRDRRRYLSLFRDNGRKIHIRYVTPLLQTKELHLDVQQVSGLQVTEAPFPYTYKGALRLQADGRWYTFLVLDKKLFKHVEQQTAATPLASF